MKSVKNPDVILFVARVENDNVKNIEKKSKNHLTIKWEFSKINSVAANANLILEN